MKRYVPFNFEERVSKTKSGTYKGKYKDKVRYFDTKEEAVNYEKTGSSKIETDIKNYTSNYYRTLAGRNISKNHNDFKDFAAAGKELLKRYKDSGGDEEEFNKIFKGHKDETEMKKNRDSFEKEIDNYIISLKNKDGDISSKDINSIYKDIFELS
jgi:hypothetical protein